MMDELKWEKKKVELSLCPYDMVVVFNMAEKLLPKKRRLLDKLLNKIPSRIIENPFKKVIMKNEINNY